MSYDNAPAAEQTIWVLFGGMNKLIHTKTPQNTQNGLKIALHMRL